jgi:uncharacterized membrane protein YhaH (DUF805 family)
VASALPNTPHGWALQALRRSLQFRGRANRAEYWWFTAFSAVPGVVISMLQAAGAEPAALLDQVDTGISAALLLPSFSAGVRRLHDIDRSGWWIGATLPLLLVWMFAVGFADKGSDVQMLLIWGGMIGLLAWLILAVVWLTRPGTPGANRFGENPLGLASEADRLAQDFA